MIYEHRLLGCAPVPLGGYLKALGIFRLVAEQVDPDARGFWRHERFVLQTMLAPEELAKFFLDSYIPSPIVGPWNGGSGFWPKDNREGCGWVLASKGPRLDQYRSAVALCRDLIELHGLKEAPKGDAKAALVAELRGLLSDEACRWLDAAVALGTDRLRFPAMLGTGGNDGRLDFTNNFMQRLQDALAPGNTSASQLSAALWGGAAAGLVNGAVGQFAPGAAGGANAGLGFEADSRVNPWDFVLNLEGALLFASAATRRLGTDTRSDASFPFSTAVTGAGSGAADAADEADGRAEFWAPLWDQPAGLEEISQLMAEGRAVVGRRTAQTGLDFARAVAGLGVARGVSSFQRHGFLKRAGLAYFATPLGRFSVRQSRRASLLADLDAGAWISRARRGLAAGTAPAAMRACFHQLEEAMFRLTQEDLPEAVQQVLTELGRLTAGVALRPGLQRGGDGRPLVPPPPLLPASWADLADDGSSEFALARALASLDASGTAGTAPVRMPFRSHCAPLAVGNKLDEWSQTSEAHALWVCTGRDLVRDLAAALERRLLEAQRARFSTPPKTQRELPLRGVPAPAEAVLAFLEGRTDDAKIQGLLSGLIWVRPASAATASTDIPEAPPMPLAFAVLKTVLAPGGIGPEHRVPNGLLLARLLRARRLPEALRRAQAIARGAGRPPAFPEPGYPGGDPLRLAAALLIPLSSATYTQLARQAFQEETQKENHDAA